jgi:UDP:flavonoid glycosyltransferase YjiC (YdhE family)
VRILVTRGVEVHYFAASSLRGAIEDDGAIFHNNGFDSWTLRDCAIYGSLALGCVPNDGILGEKLPEQAVVATLQLLPFLLEEVRKIAPDVCVSDSGYPWGQITANLLGIPILSSCSSLMFTQDEMENIMSDLRTRECNVKAVDVLKKQYGIVYDPLYSYCNYSDFTISWCNPRFLGIDISKEPRCHFFGASQPLPSSDEEALKGALTQLKKQGDDFPLADLKQKVDAGERVIYISMGTVMGTEPWSLPMVGPFYQNVFDAFKGEENTTVVVSIGKALKVQDLPLAPANYIVRNSVPQNALLRFATVFLTHNGMNSTNEAMFAGVPMVCMPCFGDQNGNAERVEDLGLGVHIKSPFAPDGVEDLNHLSSAAMKEATRKIFSDYDRFKANCDQMRVEMLSQCEYLHTKAFDDMADWTQRERLRIQSEKAGA